MNIEDPTPGEGRDHTGHDMAHDVTWHEAPYSAMIRRLTSHVVTQKHNAASLLLSSGTGRPRGEPQHDRQSSSTDLDSELAAFPSSAWQVTPSHPVAEQVSVSERRSRANVVVSRGEVRRKDGMLGRILWETLVITKRGGTNAFLKGKGVGG